MRVAEEVSQNEAFNVIKGNAGVEERAMEGQEPWGSDVFRGIMCGQAVHPSMIFVLLHSECCWCLQVLHGHTVTKKLDKIQKAMGKVLF